ncbi:MAG: hypothetical protein AAGA47_03100 [Pseudomonadota bacterium]
MNIKAFIVALAATLMATASVAQVVTDNEDDEIAGVLTDSGTGSGLEEFLGSGAGTALGVGVGVVVLAIAVSDDSGGGSSSTTTGATD